MFSLGVRWGLAPPLCCTDCMGHSDYVLRENTLLSLSFVFGPRAPYSICYAILASPSSPELIILFSCSLIIGVPVFRVPCPFFV